MGAAMRGLPRVMLGCAVVAVFSSCKKSITQPSDDSGGTGTPPALLSVGSPTKDEDPSLLTASDGRNFIAWFSDRGATSGNVFVAQRRPTDTSWSVPVRVTTNPWGNFYPNLLQTADGTIHLVWFEWVDFEVGQIRQATSTDGIQWSAEEAVTTDFLVDDWLPTIVEAPNGTLLVYFVSHKRDGNRTSDIYVAAKVPGEATWRPAAKVTTLSSPAEHDQLPFAVRTGNTITIAWVRHDTTNADFITNHRSELYVAASSDGFAWSAPTRITTDGGDHVNLFPQFYRRHDGAWWLLWRSTRSGAPLIYEMPLADVARYPAGVVVNSLMPAGYSHRVVATTVSDQYLAAWVQGPKGQEDIFYRYLTR